MRLVLLVVAVAACQRPAEKIDIDVTNLTPAPTDVAPVQVTRETFDPPRVSFDPPPAPALAARATGTMLADPRTWSIAVDVDGATGDELAVEFTMPDGTLYERQAQPLQDAPFTTQRFEFTLPIAGTWIESQQLYGEWRAHVLVGARELLAEPFTVAP